MNYYEILEVNQNASSEVIKAAYKSLMQRYHPDKNPNNLNIAERASLVVQAYEVLSDSEKRAAYDSKLRGQLTGQSSNVRGRSGGGGASAASKGRPAAKGSKSYWYLWLLIALIITSGWIIVSLLKKKPSPEAELKEIRLLLDSNQLTPKQTQDKLRRISEIFREHPEILKKEASEKEKEEASRITPIFINPLSVNLKSSVKLSETSGKPLDNAGRILFIPKLSAKVGTFESEKVIKYIENNKDLITQKLAEKLVDAKYEELIKINGEQYLKQIILDSIGDTTGTNRFLEYPPSSTESPGRYGVIDVLLPDAYSLK